MIEIVIKTQTLALPKRAVSESVVHTGHNFQKQMTDTDLINTL